MKNFILGFISVVLFAACFTASAVPEKKSKKIEGQLMSHCNRDFPELAGKKFYEIYQWIETQEMGPKADALKKTKCFASHQAWEKAAEIEATEADIDAD